MIFLVEYKETTGKFFLCFFYILILIHLNYTNFLGMCNTNSDGGGVNNESKELKLLVWSEE